MKLNELRKLIREEIEKEIKESNGIEGKIQNQLDDLKDFLGVEELPISVDDVKSKLSESKSKELKEYDLNPTQTDVNIALLIVAGIFGTAMVATYGKQVIEWLRKKLKK